jgi:threonine aldolase
LAAAGLVALEQTPPRLSEDHANARRLAGGVAQLRGVRIDPETVQTNIVIFDVADAALAPDEICARLRSDHGVLASAFGTAIRMITHYDVSSADIEQALDALQQVIEAK